MISYIQYQENKNKQSIWEYYPQITVNQVIIHSGLYQINIYYLFKFLSWYTVREGQELRQAKFSMNLQQLRNRLKQLIYLITQRVGQQDNIITRQTKNIKTQRRRKRQKCINIEINPTQRTQAIQRDQYQKIFYIRRNKISNLYKPPAPLKKYGDLILKQSNKSRNNKAHINQKEQNIRRYPRGGIESENQKEIGKQRIRNKNEKKILKDQLNRQDIQEI